MHRILLHTIVIDFPPDVHDAALGFWSAALDANAVQGTRFPEYHHLSDAVSLGRVLVQRLGEGTSRVHLDIESDDCAAEVARLTALGATTVERHGEWTVLEDPSGLRFCVVPAEAEDFAERSRVVG
jgi:Glyoxalase-like domain